MRNNSSTRRLHSSTVSTNRNLDPNHSLSNRLHLYPTGSSRDQYRSVGGHQNRLPNRSNSQL